MKQLIYNWVGKTFRATRYGYTYDWIAGDAVQCDVGGKPFIWCQPLKRISGKRGYLRSHHIFFEETFPDI